MTRQIPGYLRVHAAAETDSTPPTRSDSTHRFWRHFARATGWRIDRMPRRGPVPHLVPLSGSEEAGDPSRTAPEAALRLARSARHLMSRLRTAEAVIRRQEAELAVARDLPARPDTQRRLASRVESILRDGATALRCTAGGLYMLDESTSSLKLRVGYGLPPERLSDEARPLRGAFADLEALVSGVVAMENLADTPDWKSPENFASAICASVSAADMPVGTLWFWGDQSRRYGRRSRATARLLAGHVASELQRELLSRKATDEERLHRQLAAGADWQHHQAPLDGKLAPGWDIAGWAEDRRESSLAMGWLVWDVLACGKLATGMGHAEGGPIDAALQASAARGAWLALSRMRHTPAELMRRVSDMLWVNSCASHEVSIAYAHVQPDSGDLEMALAGDVETMVVSREGIRPLGRSSDRIGSAPDLPIGSFRTRLLPGDTLVAASGGAMIDNAHRSRGRLTQNALGQIVRSHADQPASAILAAVRRAFAEAGPTPHMRTALILQREAGQNR